ncbi:MAG: PIG-L family deacetylase, partial [Acidobacteriia bacterium]|nr:PIG-L family deacetylase [Terriglobia bacterium]
MPIHVARARFRLFLPLLVALLSGSRSVPAALPFSGTPEIEQSLRRLNELGSVLMIGAHPDDERTPVLAYFARGRHMRTAYLSATRGEGGQNLIGSEQGAQLGIIRTQELLDARRIDGGEQFFTRAIDFGFSKTPQETLEKWGRERVLSDIVWDIRRYRPDVIILCFTGTSRDGHGHHQASAILGKEAFDAAADPNRFPEQLRYVQPWRTRRLAVSIFTPPPNPDAAAGRGGAGRGAAGRGGPQNQAQDDQPPPPPLPEGPHVKIDTGAYNPILGYSYEEIAGMSRSMHRSQGMGNMGRVGSAESEFIVIGGETASRDLFDGIDTSWNRLPGGPAVASMMAEVLRDFDPAHPEKAVTGLLKARPLIAAISDPLAAAKLHDLDETIARCAGLWLEAQTKAPEVNPGSDLNVTVTALNRSPLAVTWESAAFEGMFQGDLAVSSGKLEFNKSQTVKVDRQVPASQPYTQPYWLVKPPADGVYTVEDQTLVGLPENRPILSVRFRLAVD